MQLRETDKAIAARLRSVVRWWLPDINTSCRTGRQPHGCGNHRDADGKRHSVIPRDALPAHRPGVCDRLRLAEMACAGWDPGAPMAWHLA
jgi:hypothetical protein